MLQQMGRSLPWPPAEAARRCRDTQYNIQWISVYSAFAVALRSLELAEEDEDDCEWTLKDWHCAAEVK